MSRKGCAAAPAVFAMMLKSGAALRPFRDTRPLLQGGPVTPDMTSLPRAEHPLQLRRAVAGHVHHTGPTFQLRHGPATGLHMEPAIAIAVGKPNTWS